MLCIGNANGGTILTTKLVGAAGPIRVMIGGRV